jgi:putative transposase
MIFAHKIALDLTQAQEGYCRKAAGTARFTFNWGLLEWQQQYRAGEKPTAASLKKQWNAIKYERYPWLTDIHRDAHAQPFTNLHTAFQKFFKHEAKYPTFKKKGVHDSFYIANDKVQVQGKRLYIPKLGWVRMREALRFTGKLMAVTISRIAQRWYASISVQVEIAPAVCENQAIVGVDLGVLRLATLSTGEQIEGPKPLRRLLAKLQRCSRQLSRKVKGSRNRAKAKNRLARLHARIAFQRKDALHKLSTDLVRRFGIIVLEDLHVKGMVRNHRLARAISDMGLGMFRRMVDYKATAAGGEVLYADRWFPSSKLCAACGVVCECLPLSQRVYHCACGWVTDRDFNAALHLRNYPGLEGKSTPVDCRALARTKGPGESRQSEAGPTESALLRTF